MLNERLLITKIITGLGLVFLLVVGMWSASHLESDGTAPLAASAVMTADDAVATGAHAAVADPSDDRAPVWSDSPGGVLAGVAGCLLGLFCCLLLIALFRLFALRFTPRVLELVSRPTDLLTVVARPFTPPLTLSQLSLSRT